MALLLIALAGFLGGGAFSLARTGHRIAAVVLGLAAVLAGVGAVAWWDA
jgi:hypothetical protein